MTGLEPLYRIVAACSLVWHFGFLARAAWRSDSLSSPLRQRSPTRMLFTGAWLALVLVAIVYRRPLWPWDFEMFEAVRWLSLLPAFAATFFGAWALRSCLSVDKSGELSAEGAYRWCRYPYDGAMGMFILGLGVFISNYLVLIVSLVVFFATRILVPWEQERRRHQRFGDRYLLYAEESGIFLPSVEAVPQEEYTVPKRFGMTAILGLLTTLAVIFGALNYSIAPPVVYLFIGTEIVGICLAQIFLGSAARSGSALTGAVLLPFWAYLMLHIPRFDPLVHLALLASMLAVGALLGYCIGALAAGFFLAMDVIESLLTSDSADETPVPPPLEENSTTDERRYKELKSRITNRV